MQAAGRRRRIRASLPEGRSALVLGALVAAGTALRVLVTASWWPATTTLQDSASYARVLDENPFVSHLHPAGYGIVLEGFGAVTREVAAVVLVQHLAGIASALLLFAATRRVTGVAWAGLLPAAVALLNPDQIVLEHSIMSESWAVLLTAAGLYAAARAFDEPRPAWRWPLLAGILLALSVTIRTAGLPLVVVAVAAIAIWHARGSAGWRAAAAPAGAATAGAVVVLLVFAAAGSHYGGRFGVGPSPGWYLYGRVAQFADCSRFTPPPRTEVLCETTPPERRLGARHYLFNPSAPGPRHFRAAETADADHSGGRLLAQWSRRAIAAQPLDYARSVWRHLRVYWLPGAVSTEDWHGEALDPALDATRAFADDLPSVLIRAHTEAGMEEFFYPFDVTARRPGLRVLRAWQTVGRFGTAFLWITTILTIAGLFASPRRLRCGVLLFGVGGLVLLAAPALTGNFIGRYMVPMAGPMTAGAAVALVALWPAVARRIARGRAAPG